MNKKFFNLILNCLIFFYIENEFDIEIAKTAQQVEQSNAEMFRRDNDATVSKTSLEIDAFAGWGNAGTGKGTTYRAMKV